MSSNGLSQEDLDILRQYDTPTICNVIEVFDVQPRTAGYMDGRIRACFPEMPPLVGYAVTATWRAAAPAAGGAEEGYDSLADQVGRFADVPNPPIVVFQDLDDPTAAASFGEIMCATYRKFGAIGLITSGAARDLEQVRELGFTVFSDGAICSHGYGHIESLQVPVNIGGTTVLPGDLLHADCNGVTTIPNEIAADVAHLCAEYVAAEEVILDYLKSESVTPEGLGAARVESKRQLDALFERVRQQRA